MSIVGQGGKKFDFPKLRFFRIIGLCEKKDWRKGDRNKVHQYSNAEWKKNGSKGGKNEDPL